MMAASDSPQIGRGGRVRSASTSSGGSGISAASAAGVSVGSSAFIRPQPVTEKSLMESVAGFIQEATSPATGHQGHGGLGGSAFGGGGGGHDPRVHVVWARFEVADVNDVRLFPEGAEINGNAPPLLLVLGYTQGVQVWLIPMTGEAQEVLSWKQGSVKTLRLLPAPESCFGHPDNFEHCRPLIAMADSAGPGTPFSSATFISLRSGEQVLRKLPTFAEVTTIAYSLSHRFITSSSTRRSPTSP